MNIMVFGVGNWDTRSDADEQRSNYKEWHSRLCHYMGNPKEVFITPGSYSNPDYCPISDTKVVQIGIQKTKQYSSLWSYFRVGFFTGIYHALLNPGWDLLVHCQTRMLLGTDMVPHLKEFLNRPEQIMAPKWTSTNGTQIEVALLAMKPDAVRKYATSTLRSSLIEKTEKQYSLNSEHECLLMFSDEWYNPFPEVFSTRKMSVGYTGDGDRDFELDMSTFLKLPFISGNRHCSKEDLKLWCEMHPIDK